MGNAGLCMEAYYRLIQMVPEGTLETYPAFVPVWGDM